MKNILTSMYLSGKLSDSGLDAAVVKGWITEADAAEIRALKEEQDG